MVGAQVDHELSDTVADNVIGSDTLLGQRATRGLGIGESPAPSRIVVPRRLGPSRVTLP